MILVVKTLSFLVTHRTNFYWCKVIENNNYCKQLWEEGKGRNSKGYMYFLVVVLVLLRFPHRQSELVVPLGIVSIACINKQRIIKHTEQLQVTNIACLTNNKKLYSSFFTIANSLWASCLISNTYLNGMIKFDFSWFEYNLRWIIKNLLLGKFPNIRFFMWLLFLFRSNIFNLNWFLFHFQFCGFLQTLSYIILSIILLFGFNKLWSKNI